MNRLAVHVSLGLLACVATAEPVRAASVNPFDPSLSPDIHTFATCNFELEDHAEESATCTHARVEENPTTLTQVLGTGDASSDLRTGVLSATSSAQAYRFGDDNLRANASGVAQLYETISVDGGYEGQVEVRMTVTGSMLAATAGGPQFGQTVASLWAFDDQGNELGTASLWVDQYSSGGAYESNRFSYGLPTFIFTNADLSGNFDPSDIEVTVAMYFDVTAAQPEFTFGARLATSAGLGPFIAIADQLQTNDVDFGDTAEISVIVPAGVTWTSSSGVFLVPEPSAAAMLGAGCLALVGLARRRGID
jgi:hypothetical protein